MQNLNDNNLKILVSQGAEARIYKIEDPGSGVIKIVKERFSKSYRHAVLDAKLVKGRTKHEVKNLKKCRQLGLMVPSIFNHTDSVIELEYLNGSTLKNYIQQLSLSLSTTTTTTTTSIKVGIIDNEQQKWMLLERIGEMIGSSISKLHHHCHIIHGDLTTSNFMIVKKNQCVSGEEKNMTLAGNDDSSSAIIKNGDDESLISKYNKFLPSDLQVELYFIDFGLSFTSLKEEDMAVDLYVMERTLNSTHPQESEVILKSLFKAYRNNEKYGKKVLEKLEAVRQRGRKRDMVG